jgi:hypothetical protein
VDKEVNKGPNNKEVRDITEAQVLSEEQQEISELK